MLDAVVATWTAGWIVLGVLVGHDVHQLTQLTATVDTTGRALRAVAAVVSALRSLPLIGSSIAPLAHTAVAEAASVQASGRVGAQSVRQLSVLLAVAVAAAPTVPLLALYVPLRVSQEREARAFRRALRAGVDDAAFREFLAQRAVQNLPYHRLREITENPWRDLREGRFRTLSDAELRRVGVLAQRRPPEPRRLHAPGPP